MLCKKAAADNFQNLPDSCYMCCQKLTTVDSQYANLYGFSEAFIRTATNTIGFRTEEDGVMYPDQYEVCVSGHGFSPRDVNQNLLKQPQGTQKDFKYASISILPFQSWLKTSLSCPWIVNS